MTVKKGIPYTGAWLTLCEGLWWQCYTHWSFATHAAPAMDEARLLCSISSSGNKYAKSQFEPVTQHSPSNTSLMHLILSMKLMLLVAWQPSVPSATYLGSPPWLPHWLCRTYKAQTPQLSLRLYHTHAQKLWWGCFVLIRLMEGCSIVFPLGLSTGMPTWLHLISSSFPPSPFFSGMSQFTSAHWVCPCTYEHATSAHAHTCTHTHTHAHMHARTHTFHIWYGNKFNNISKYRQNVILLYMCSQFLCNMIANKEFDNNHVIYFWHRISYG